MGIGSTCKAPRARLVATSAFTPTPESADNLSKFNSLQWMIAGHDQGVAHHSTSMAQIGSKSSAACGEAGGKASERSGKGMIKKRNSQSTISRIYSRKLALTYQLAFPNGKSSVCLSIVSIGLSALYLYALSTLSAPVPRIWARNIGTS